MREGRPAVPMRIGAGGCPVTIATRFAAALEHETAGGPEGADLLTSAVGTFLIGLG